jgi:hypothetical protein
MSAGYGRVAYEAYVEHCGGKSVRGEDLPSWEDQAPEIRAHWEQAAARVIRAYLGKMA